MRAMNPYRETQRATIEVRRGRTRRRVLRKTIGFLLMVPVAFVTPWLSIGGTWSLGAWVALLLTSIVLASAGRSRSAFVRLCALQWNRGDRLGATLLLFNVIEPRYSAKRIAKNKAALEAAQVGMPKMSTFAIPFVKDDDE
jgi:hypothetical protein